MPMPSTPPKLWIIATPLGNPEDLSPRARETLANADLVLAEDTRRAARLFAQCGLRARKIISFFEHNEQERQPEILKVLENGASIALITDAGTPLLADPGYRLVRACRQNGFSVSPVPGPSAPVAAISAAGIAPIPFTFLGFLPRGAKGREKLFLDFSSTPGSLVFFERKDRLEESLEMASRILGPREMAICRELTKTYEEFITGKLANFRQLAAGLLGEITVVIGPPEFIAQMPEDKVLEIFTNELAKGVKPRKAAALAHPQCPGWTVAEIYALAARHKNSD